jgi:hypothetical protein
MAQKSKDIEEGNFFIQHRIVLELIFFLEERHFANVIRTFSHYAQYSVNFIVFLYTNVINIYSSTQLSANNRRRKDLYSLQKADQDVLNDLGYKEKLEAIDKAILVNASFLAQIVQDPEIFGHDLDEEATSAESESETTHGDIAGRYRLLIPKFWLIVLRRINSTISLALAL